MLYSIEFNCKIKNKQSFVDLRCVSYMSGPLDDHLKGGLCKRNIRNILLLFFWFETSLRVVM